LNITDCVNDHGVEMCALEARTEKRKKEREKKLEETGTVLH